MSPTQAVVVLLCLLCFASCADVVIEDFQIDGTFNIPAQGEGGNVMYSPNLWNWRELWMKTFTTGPWTKGMQFWPNEGFARVAGDADFNTAIYRYQFQADSVSFPDRINPTAFQFPNGIDGTAGGNTGLVAEFKSLYTPLHLEITIADIFGNSNVAEVDYPSDYNTVTQTELHFNQYYWNVDASKIAYISIFISSDYDWSYEGLYFSNVIQTCFPTCAGRDCGDNACGGVCGTCFGSDQCNAAGVCTPPVSFPSSQQTATQITIADRSASTTIIDNNYDPLAFVPELPAARCLRETSNPLWYQVVSSPIERSITVFTCESDVDTAIAVYLADGSLLACNDDDASGLSSHTCNSFSSFVSATIPAGAEFFIVVSAFSTGEIDLHITSSWKWRI